MPKLYSPLLAALAFAALTYSGASAVPPHRTLPKLRVSDNHHFLVQANGKMFFYLGDTAWELFHRLNRADAVRYLDTRAAQGYTVIQAVALSELDGIFVPNAYGDLPLVNRDPTKPAITPGSNPKNAQQYDYWDHVQYIIDQANRRGLYIGLLPTWGRWVVKDKGESIFTPASAQAYGEFLGKRFRNKGIIWILGGDRKADGVEEIWRAMAKGIAIGVNGREDYTGVLITFHPNGGGSSSKWFQNDPWLAFNMQQDGHGIPGISQSWKKIQYDYSLTPPKPVIDGEPLYEDHPLNFNSKLNGYSFDAHVRKYLYWDLFSGACGHTYGNHAVWQMYAPGRAPVNGPLMYWYEAIERPGGRQMQYARHLLESRAPLTRIPDQTLVSDELQGVNHIAATRGSGYAFIYTAEGRPFTVNLGKISGTHVKCSWFNPRSGDTHTAGEFANTGQRLFTPPSVGFGSDWVLILDDASKHFAPASFPSHE